MRRAALWLVTLVALAVAPAAALANTIALLLSGQGGSYAEVSAAIQAELRRAPASRFASAVVGTPAADELLQSSPALLVAVGTRATQAALRGGDARTPVLAVLVPRASFEALLGTRGPEARAEARGADARGEARSADGRAEARSPEARDADGRGGEPRAREPRRVSAVYLDQPPQRQLELVRQALPGLVRIGVVVGQESARDLDRLKEAADGRGLRLVSERVASDSELFPALQRVMGESDVFLALPDPRVITPETAQNLLITSYRMRTPVIGYSAAYVRAGALIAVYSTPTQAGAQAGEIARNLLRGAPLPAPQFPRQFSVSVNRQVARSLALEIDDEQAVRERIARQEGD